MLFPPMATGEHLPIPFDLAEANTVLDLHPLLLNTTTSVAVSILESSDTRNVSKTSATS